MPCLRICNRGFSHSCQPLIRRAVLAAGASCAPQAPPPSPSSGAAGQSAGVLHWLKPDEAFYKPDQVSWVDAVGADAATDSADGANTTPGQDWSVGLDGWVATIGDTHLVNSQSVVAVVDPMYPNIYLPTTQAKLIRTLRMLILRDIIPNLSYRRWH